MRSYMLIPNNTTYLSQKIDSFRKKIDFNDQLREKRQNTLQVLSILGNFL